jgi:hypothetical protein
MSLRRSRTGTKRKSFRSKPKKATPFGSAATLADGSVPERVIQAEILSWLKKTGAFAWRQNSGKIPVHGRLVNLGPDGISDVVVVVPPTGRFMGLEVKSAKGKLRPVQAAFRDKLLSVGGHYVVVRSLKEAQEALAAAMGVEVLKQCMASPRSSSESRGFLLS